MDFENITSRENRLVKSLKKLMSSSSCRRENGLFVLEGLRLSCDAVQNGYSVETVIITENFADDIRLSELFCVAKQRVIMPESLFKFISDTVNPQGVMCTVKTPETLFSADSIRSGKYIMLENTADPANLGAIARTAEALGVSGLIVSSSGCDPFSPKSQRAAMGALLRLPIFLFNDCKSEIELLKQKGFTVYASVVSKKAESLLDVRFCDDSVVLIGNEANGLTDTAISSSDISLTINMKGRAESLNAAAAAAIIMWQMTKAGDPSQ